MIINDPEEAKDTSLAEAWSIKVDINTKKVVSFDLKLPSSH